MLALQVAAGGPVSIWPRAAIHDTVAAIVRQPAYRRDLTTTLFDRVLRWLAEMFDRLTQAVADIPHGRFVATLAAAVVVGLVVARLVYAARLRAPQADAEAAERGGRARSDDPWRQAEQLAANGEYTEAAHALYRAALVMLAGRGLVRLHDSKTSGDYARELRRRGSPAYAPFRRFGARYDRIIYGTGTCDAAGYTSLLDDARALSSVRGSERAA